MENAANDEPEGARSAVWQPPPEPRAGDAEDCAAGEFAALGIPVPDDQP